MLVYANLARSPFHQQAVGALNDLVDRGTELWVSRQVLREYLSSMTRQNTLTSSVSISSLIADVRYFSDRFSIAEESALVTENLLTLMEHVEFGGTQVQDANIVATMLAHDIRQILTHNVSDFGRFAQFIEVVPLAGE